MHRPGALSCAGRRAGRAALPGRRGGRRERVKDQHLYDAMIDSFSMRDFVPSAGISGHDQFFATFERFGGLDKSHTASGWTR